MLSQKIILPTSSRLTCFLPAPDMLNEPLLPKWRDEPLFQSAKGLVDFPSSETFKSFLKRHVLV